MNMGTKKQILARVDFYLQTRKWQDFNTIITNLCYTIWNLK